MNKKLGQFFTTNIILKEKIHEFILNNPENILEPSIGQGDLIDYILTKNKKIKFDMYEIDNKIKLLKTIKKKDVIYCDFLEQKITKKYKTIVGNPPYIKTEKGNIYIDFISKCYNLLDINGELIFIIPSDFFKLTSASKLINIMMDNGTFTHIFHPNDEKLFDDASIDVVVFRYWKNSSVEKKILYNNDLLYINNSDGLITFNKELNDSKILFKDYFDVYVGIVSGKENVYKNELGNIEVINGENKVDKYIFMKKFPCDNKEINDYMLEHKKELLDRKIRKFNDNNWYEWGAPRNIKAIINNLGKDCIYISTLTRNKKIAFVSKISYFGGGLIMIKPKKKCNLDKIVEYLNSDLFKHNFVFSGRFKIGHRQISNSYIPNKLLQ